MSDRTAEFISALRSMESKQQLSGTSELRSRRKNAATKPNNQLINPDYVSFMEASRIAARELCLTFQKLEKLNELARKRTIFDSEESSRELNELVYIIKKDINSLNQQIEELGRIQASRLERSKSNNVESHSKNVVISLQQKLATMSNNFKTTLELRSQNMQQQKARREQFTSPTFFKTAANNNGFAVIDFGSDSTSSNTGNGSLAINANRQKQLSLQYEDGQFIEERANAVQSIESTIVELGTILNQLATMVQQQDDMIVRIDANIADTALNVEAAHQSLLRYFQSVTNNRWLMLKVFGVLFFFFMVFLVVA